MSNRVPSLLVNDILVSCNKILHYTQGMTLQGFLDDPKTVDAVIRNFEIIGEAANRLPEEFKEAQPQIDWHRIRGFRNRIVHDYMGIDFEIVWDIRTHYLSDLIKLLKAL